MGHAPLKVQLERDSELAVAISRALRSGQSILVDTGDTMYFMSVEEVIEKGKRPTEEQVKRSREGILKASGGWQNLDTEAFKMYIAKRRRTASRPSVSL